ncbi:hypothetical protein HHI36_012591 [Cryptolaemus montrouzieri]|uniref:Uncharacterized protein n=1 Tax=Cryptolaemus montrouzieri TaxID=559131 RepID=A0ABD2NFC7_9CUCU
MAYSHVASLSHLGEHSQHQSIDSFSPRQRGNLSTDNKTSASIFVDTFSKASSRELAGPLPRISTRRNQNTISDVTISPELVEAAFKGLK